MFRPSDIPAAEPAKKVKKPAKPAKSAEQNDKKLSLFETIAEELAEIEKVHVAPDPDETRAIPWSPRLSGSYEEDEDQDAPVLGRLMGRAFGQRRDEEQ